MKKMFLLFRLCALALILTTSNGAFAHDTKFSAFGTVRDGIRYVSTTEAATILRSDRTVRVLDVRTPMEYYQGHIENAVRANYLWPFFRENLSELDKNTTWIVHCKSGHRSAPSVRIMTELGFKSIIHMNGGMDAWRAAGLPVSF